MASDMNNHKYNIAKPSPLLLSEIGPDGLLRESSVISYTEQIIEKEQLQLRKYIEENYSKIRDVEKEFTNLNLEMKLTAGPKKAALEHMRKKIELSTEKIRLARVKEDGNNPVAPVPCATAAVSASAATSLDHSRESPGNLFNEGNASVPKRQQPRADGIQMKNKILIHGREKGIRAVLKGRGSASPGWTGAGFDVDGRTS